MTALLVLLTVVIAVVVMVRRRRTGTRITPTFTVEPSTRLRLRSARKETL